MDGLPEMCENLSIGEIVRLASTSPMMRLMLSQREIMSGIAQKHGLPTPRDIPHLIDLDSMTALGVIRYATYHTSEHEALHVLSRNRHRIDRATCVLNALVDLAAYAINVGKYLLADAIRAATFEGGRRNYHEQLTMIARAAKSSQYVNTTHHMLMRGIMIP